MLSNNGEKTSQCPCCKACDDCSDSNNAVAVLGTNLAIYQRTLRNPVNMKPPKTSKADDIVILETTEDQKFARFDSMSAPELQDVYCPRCKYIVERTKIMLQTGKLDKNFVRGMCVHCRQISQPQIRCYKCEEITQKFISRLWEQSDNSKHKLKTWLAKVKHLLKDVRENDQSADKEKHRLRGPELHSTRFHGTTDTQRSVKEPKIIISSKQKSNIPEDKILKSLHDTKSIYKSRSFDSFLHYLSNISGVKVASEKFSKKYGSKTDRNMPSSSREYDSDYARDAQYVLKPSRRESPGRREHDSYYLSDNINRSRTDHVPSPGGLNYGVQYPSDKPDNIISPGMRNYDIQYPSDKETKLKPERISPNMMDDYDIQALSDKKSDRIIFAGSQNYESKYKPDKKYIAKSDRRILRGRQEYDSDYLSDKKYESETESRTIRNIREYGFHYRDHKKTSKKGKMSPFESLDKLIHEEYLKQSMPELKKDEKNWAKEYTKRLPKSVALDDALTSKSPMHRSRSETTILDAGEIVGPSVLESVTDIYKGHEPKTTLKKIKHTISPYRSPHKKFPSEEILPKLVSAQSEPLLRKDFSYQFPKEIVVKKEPKGQRTSAELIKETQDMLNMREEEKKQRLEIERVKKKHDEKIKKEAREEKKRLQEENRREQEELKRIAEREKQLAQEETRRLEEERKRKEEKITTLEDKNIRETEKLRVKDNTKIKDEDKLIAKDVKKKKEYDGRYKEMQGIQNKERSKEEKEKAKEEKERAKEEKERIKAEKERAKAEKERAKAEKKKDEETIRRVKEEAKVKENPGKVDKEKVKDNKEDDKLKKQKEKEIQDRMEKEEKLREKGDKDRLKKEKEDQLRAEKEQKRIEKEDGQKKKQFAGDQQMKDDKTESKEGKKQKDKADKKEKQSKDAAQPESKDKTPYKEFELKHVKIRRPSYDDLILRLVRLKQMEPGEKKGHEEKILLENLPIVAREHLKHRHNKEPECLMCRDSNVELDVESILMNTDQVETTFTDIIIGQKIYRYKPQQGDKEEKAAVIPSLFQSTFNAMSPNVDSIHSETVIPAETASKQPILAPPKFQKQVEEVPKGVIRYALSDRAFIDKGWTMLPTEKVMNVYRMRPAHPEFDWFERNKKKKLMLYDTGEKLAEFDDNGRSRIYYKNGRLALDYYDAEEVNAHQRFVVFSNGELDERGRSHPITILATFDYLGNGIVFDNGGKIRLKYNQTEGVVLDRNIGPVSNWKWHTLNDPPVLQKVMIDTQMAHKDPDIYKMGGPADDKSRPDNEEMLAIEFDNFIKEKSKKLTQTFKPFQIKMKALKINENFSLKILDQATIYLIFRDSTANVKLNLGMILDHKEIVDTDTAEVGEVSNSLERFPARTESLAGLQRSVAYAQRFERARIERERRLRPPEPCTSADQLTAAASRPLRPPLRNVPSASTTVASSCKCSRKPCSSNIYYDTRLI